MSVTKDAKTAARARTQKASASEGAGGAARRHREKRVMEVRFVSQRASTETSYRVATYRSLERIAKRAGMDDVALARFLGVSLKTLARRTQRGVLGEAESMKTEMLAKTFDEAIRILGDEGKARRWLASPIVSLDGLRPIDHLDSIDGYERVRETLTKVEYGMY